MRCHRRVLFTWMLSLVIAGTAAAEDTTKLREAIDAMNKSLMEAVGRGDAAAVAAFYAQDAMALPPGSDAVSGAQAIQTLWQSMVQGVKQLKVETVGVDGAGDLAVEVGRYTVVGANDQTLDSGKYLVVWKQQDGQWKIYRDIWNSSVEPEPAAEPAAATKP